MEKTITLTWKLELIALEDIKKTIDKAIRDNVKGCQVCSLCVGSFSCRDRTLCKLAENKVWKQVSLVKKE